MLPHFSGSGSGDSAGPDDHRAVRLEARAVARAVPGAFSASFQSTRQPMWVQTADRRIMCPARRDNRDRLAVQLEHAARPRGTARAATCRRPPSDRESCSTDSPCSPGGSPRGRRGSSLRPRVEQLAPRVLSPEHDRSAAIIAGERAERHPVAGEAGAGELARRRSLRCTAGRPASRSPVPTSDA